MRRRLGWMVGGFLLLVVVGLVVLRLALPADRLREEAVRRAAAATGYAIELGDLELGLSRRGLSLKTDRLAIANPELAAAAAPFLTVGSLEIDVAALPLLRREVQVTRLVLKRPVIELRRDREGRLNTAVRRRPPSAGREATSGAAREAEPASGAAGEAQPASGASAAGILLAVPEARIEDARFSLVDEAAGTTIECDDLDGVIEIALRPGEIALAGALTVAALAGRAGGDPSRAAAAHGPYDLALDFALAYQPEPPAALDVRSCSLTLGELEVRASGSIRSLEADPVLDLEFSTGRFEPARALSLIPTGVPPGLELAGVAELSGTLRGRAPEPELEGALRILDVDVTPPGDDAPLVAALRGEVRFTRDGAAIPGLEGKVPGGTFTLEAQLSDFARPRIEATVAVAADLAEAVGRLDLLPEHDLRRGRVEAQLECKVGAPDFGRSLEARGTVELREVVARFEGVGPTVRVDRLSARLGGRSLEIEPLALSAGGSDLEGNLRLASLDDPTFTFRLRSNRLDLDELLRPPGARRAAGETASSGGKGVAGSPASPPPLPAATGTIAAETLVYRGLTASQVSLRATVGAGGLRLEDVAGRLLGGSLSGSLHARPAPGDSLRYTSSLRVEGVEASQLLSATTPLGNQIHGTLDADLDLHGLRAPGASPVDLLNADGNTTLTDGYLEVTGALGTILRQLGVVDGERLDFERFVSRLVVRDGRVQLDNGKMLSGRHGDFHIGGSIGFDRSLAIELSALVPSRYLPKAVTANPQLVRLLADDRGRVPLGFTIGGDLDRPVVQLHLQELEHRFQSRLREEAASALEKRVGEQVGGFLKGLLGGDDRKDD